jgi:predicted dehydrogenase
MPEKITAVCHEGKWHDIEVEDDVMIYAEYPNGATGTFITTTGDFPGTNRLEITLDKAKLICEDGKLTVCEVAQSVSEFTKNAAEGFGRIDTESFEAELDGRNIQHPEVMNKFAAAILRGEPLTAAGQEGINGLMISNAAFLSSWLGKSVTLPIDEELFYNMLQDKIKNSSFVKEVKEIVNEDMDSTY